MVDNNDAVADLVDPSDTHDLLSPTELLLGLRSNHNSGIFKFIR